MFSGPSHNYGSITTGGKQRIRQLKPGIFYAAIIIKNDGKHTDDTGTKNIVKKITRNYVKGKYKQGIFFAGKSFLSLRKKTARMKNRL